LQGVQHQFVDQPKECHVHSVTSLPETISVDIHGGADKRDVVARIWR